MPPMFFCRNLGNGHPVVLADFVRVIEENVGKKAQIDSVGMQKGDVPLTYADVTKARYLIGKFVCINLFVWNMFHWHDILCQSSDEGIDSSIPVHATDWLLTHHPQLVPRRILSFQLCIWYRTVAWCRISFHCTIQDTIPKLQLTRESENLSSGSVSTMEESFEWRNKTVARVHGQRISNLHTVSTIRLDSIKIALLAQNLLPCYLEPT